MTGMNAEFAARAQVFHKSGLYHTLKSQVHLSCAHAIYDAACKRHLEFVVRARAKIPFVNFPGKFLRVSPSAWVIFAAAACGWNADPASACGYGRCPEASKFLHNSSYILHIDIQYLRGHARR